VAPVRNRNRARQIWLSGAGRRDDVSRDEVERIVILNAPSEVAPAQGANLRLSYATKKLKNFKGSFPVAEVLNYARGKRLKLQFSD
jgi:hypothetical protein